MSLYMILTVVLAVTTCLLSYDTRAIGAVIPATPPVSSQYCHYETDEGGVFWLECPGVGLVKTLSMGVNHVENCDPHNTVKNGTRCPPGTFGPPQYSKLMQKEICPWFCDSYDTSINASSYSASTQARYGNTSAWAKVAIERLLSWGFNSIGSWSSPLLTGDAAEGTLLQPAVATPGMVYGYSLDMLKTSYEHRMATDTLVDVWDPTFAVKCADIAELHAKPRRNDTHLLGYWTDNENEWSPKLNGGDDLLTSALRTWTGASQVRTIQWITAKYNNSIPTFNKAWEMDISSWSDLTSATRFTATSQRTADNLAYVSEYVSVYFATVKKAITNVDPNHMILGSRNNVNGDILYAFARGAGPYVDVMDYHCYETDPCFSTLHQLHNITGLPVLISEFGFRAEDSGLPNTMGAGPLVTTQSKRAAAYKKYVAELVALPFIIGYHMFMYYDEPAGKQLFGADSNFGLVHSDDDIYTLITQAFTRINAAAPNTHSAKLTSQ